MYNAISLCLFLFSFLSVYACFFRAIAINETFVVLSIWLQLRRVHLRAWLHTYSEQTRLAQMFQQQAFSFRTLQGDR
jgi:hypothetical protein